MNAFPDTSFLCAIYRQQDNTEAALTVRASLKEPLQVSSLVLFEFRQSARMQTFLYSKDTRKGFGEKVGAKMLADLQSDIDAGLVQIVPVDWAKVHSTAEGLSSQHTVEQGHRALDILHVATALELDAKQILTFDGKQRRLAAAAGLKLLPRTMPKESAGR